MDPERLCINCMNEMPAGTSVCPVCRFDASGYHCAPHVLPPFTILNGRYLLGKTLGAGGFGITYMAYDLSGNMRVAIKELYLSELLYRMPSGDIRVDARQGSIAFYNACKDKFLREAYMLQELEDKQGIVNIYDFFEEHNTAYIVMEYLDGADLSNYLNKAGGKLSFTEAFELLRPIMHSLISMHRAGIFHRDISPDNIRCLSNGGMKVMDLGSAKYNYSEENSGIVSVKKGYAPQEQYTSGFKVGPWMDVYAIAATFYRCITGEKPKESIARADDDDISLPSAMGAAISRKQEKVLLKGLALRPEDRYQDMREFYNALKEAAGFVTTGSRGTFIQRMGGIWKSAGRKPEKQMDQAPAANPTGAYAEEIARMNSDRGKNQRMRMIAAVVGAACILAVVLILSVTGVLRFPWQIQLPVMR